jgi:hypothetical protein
MVLCWAVQRPGAIPIGTRTKEGGLIKVVSIAEGT